MCITLSGPYETLYTFAIDQDSDILVFLVAEWRHLVSRLFHTKCWNSMVWDTTVTCITMHKMLTISPGKLAEYLLQIGWQNNFKGGFPYFLYLHSLQFIIMYHSQYVCEAFLISSA